MIAACPDCGNDMQDCGFEFWCSSCQQAVSFAKAIAVGVSDD